MADSSVTLTTEFHRRADELLRRTDDDLRRFYPGDDGTRQPVHSCYIPADQVGVETARQWGEDALAASDAAGGLVALAELAGVAADRAAELADAVKVKLSREPIEDMRLDLEDGYGIRPDAEEDAAAIHAAHTVAAMAAERHRGERPQPEFLGIRFKCFEEDVRARGLRTLDLFLTTLIREGQLARRGVADDGLPPGLVLTFPKVSNLDQVHVLLEALETFEKRLDLAPGRLRFELQIETPAAVLGLDGRSPLPAMIADSGGRVSALHYGTYDYSASLGVAANFQSLEHPGADHAKAVMQVAAAGTGVRLSDGSSNVLPVGDDDQRRGAWLLHARLVRRSLERAFYQGWDLHAHQLPTRYLVNYDFYRGYFDAAAERLHVYANRNTPGIEASAIADEPATARALAGFVHRGVMCGAIRENELHERASMNAEQLRALAYPKSVTI